MLQEFFIKKGSILPVLRIELIDSGKYDFEKNDIMTKALQDAKVYFTMKNIKDNSLVISKSKANVKFSNDSGCSEKAVIEYEWKPRDTKKEGTFSGEFEIIFNEKIKEEGKEFPIGNLKVPIQEDLIIYIK